MNYPAEYLEYLNKLEELGVQLSENERMILGKSKGKREMQTPSTPTGSFLPKKEVNNYE